MDMGLQGVQCRRKERNIAKKPHSFRKQHRKSVLCCCRFNPLKTEWEFPDRVSVIFLEVKYEENMALDLKYSVDPKLFINIVPKGKKFRNQKQEHRVLCLHKRMTASESSSEALRKPQSAPAKRKVGGTWPVSIQQ